MFGLMGVARNGGQPGGAVVNPLSLSPKVWYDPSDLSTMFQDTAGTTPVTAAGQSVARINDKSGNGNHATQATAGSRPTLGQDGNGNYYLQFTSSDFLETAGIDLTGTDEFTAFAGFQLDTATNDNPVYDFSGGVGAGSFFANTNGANFYTSVRGASASVTRQISSAMVANTPYVLTQRANLGQLPAFLATGARLNSTDRVASTFAAGPSGGGNFANANLRIGRLTTVYLRGRVYQFILTDKVEDSNVLNAEQYINSKMLAYTAATRTANAIGDSTIVAYLGQNDVMFYIDSAFTENTNAVAGHTIAQQQTAWLASTTRGDPEWAVIQIGLNNLDPSTATATSIAALQAFTNAVVATTARARVLIAQMIPCRQRLIYLYGAINGPIAYQKWLDMNDAIAGNGASPITGVDGRITAHVALLNDGAGNLAAAYDTGDGVHENNAGREIIAAAWTAALSALGPV